MESELEFRTPFSALVYCSQSNLEIANEVDQILRRRAWESQVVATGARHGSAASRPPPSKAVSANIVLMDRELYSHDRRLFEAIGDFCAQDSNNMFVISRDTDWGRINSEWVKPIFSRSFVSEYSKSLIDELAGRIEQKTSIQERVYSPAILAELIGSLGTQHRIVEKENSAQQGRFELHAFRSALQRHYSYILVIYDEASLAKSKAAVLAALPDLLFENLTIVRPSAGSTLTPKQRQNVNTLFPQAQCLSFDEFLATDISERPTLPNLTYKNELLVDADCQVSIRQGAQTLVDERTFSAKCEIDAVIDRIRSDVRSKVVLIYAPGGTGKSHLARYANDRLLERGSEVVYLDADLIRERLSSESYQNISIRTLYDIYRLCVDDKRVTVPLSESKFKLRFRLRDTAIIVDGLEEIYALLGTSFNVDALLSDCQEYLELNLNGLVLFTSRKDFWTDSEYSQFRILTLNSFTENNAHTFFTQLFQRDKERVSRATQLLKGIADKQGRFLPLYCDIIGRTLLEMSPQELSAYVRTPKSRQIEELLFWVLDREMERTNTSSWGYEVSLSILKNLALSTARTSMESESAKLTLAGCLGREATSAEVIALQNHKLLVFESKSKRLDFRHPFVKTTLLSKGIVDEFERAAVGSKNSHEHRTQIVQLYAILGTSLAIPGSELSDAIVEDLKASKVVELQSEVRQFISNHSFNVIGLRPQRGPLSETRHLLNNVFFAYLRAYSVDLDDLESNTKVLCECFSTGKELLGVTLVGYSHLKDVNVRFDFSGMKVVNGLFADFSSFWRCEADEQTSFEECLFQRCVGRSQANPSILKANLQTCELDKEFDELVETKSDNTLRRKTQVVKNLKSIFKKTSVNQDYRRGKDEAEMEEELTLVGSVSFRHYIDALKAHGLLFEYETPGGTATLLRVPDQYHADVRSFVNDSVPSKRIASVIDELV